MRFRKFCREVYPRIQLKHLLLDRELLVTSYPESFAIISFLLAPMVEICTRQYDSPVRKKLIYKKEKINSSNNLYLKKNIKLLNFLQSISMHVRKYYTYPYKYLDS